MRVAAAILMVATSAAMAGETDYEAFQRHAESVSRMYRDLANRPVWTSPTAPLASERYEPQQWSVPPASYPELTKPLPMRSTRCRPIGNSGAMQCWSD